MSPTGPALALLAGAILAAGWVPPALAQQRGNAQAEQSRGLIGSNPDRVLPPSGQYVAETGERFVLDRSGSRALFRFDRRQETWALRPTPAPRGDVIYRNDEGTRVLRVSADGGMTLYTVRAPNGTPATMIGPADSLAITILGPGRLFQLMNQRSGLITQALGRIVAINLDGERSEALVVDALMVTTEAVLRMARSATMRGRLSGLRSITIVEGDRVSARYSRGDLRIVVDPDAGTVAGRPTSTRIIRAFDSQ